MRLLILGTGGMAANHAEAFGAIADVTLAGCVDIDEARAGEFAEKFGIEKLYGSLDDALSTGGFDALTNVTPDKVHCETTLQALEAGLHVFCEKPLATNALDAQRMTDKAEELRRVNGVNLSYRNVSALRKAREIVEEGRLGELRHFEASYLQSWLTQPAWGEWSEEEQWLWRLSEAHGSLGVLGDVGIHIFDFATYAAASDIIELSSTLTTFPKAPGNRIGAYTLDANDSMTMTATLNNGATGVIHASRFATGHLNDLSLSLYGTKGGLQVTNQGDLGTLRICEGSDMETATWRDIALSPVTTNYVQFAEAVAAERPMKPDFATATRLQRVIDLAYSASLSRRRESVPENA